MHGFGNAQLNLELKLRYISDFIHAMFNSWGIVLWVDCDQQLDLRSA